MNELHRNNGIMAQKPTCTICRCLKQFLGGKELQQLPTRNTTREMRQLRSFFFFLCRQSHFGATKAAAGADEAADGSRTQVTEQKVEMSARRRKRTAHVNRVTTKDPTPEMERN